MHKHELYYRIAHSQLQEQDQRIRDFDFKAAGVLGLAFTLAGIAAVILKDFTGDDPKEITCWTVAAVIIFSGAFFSCVLCALLALRQRDWYGEPKLVDLAKKVENCDDAAVFTWTGDWIKCSVDGNQPTFDTKSGWLGRSLRALGALICALVFLVLSTFL